LILGELLTNACTAAFHGNNCGKILVSFGPAGAGPPEPAVEDNRIGLPAAQLSGHTRAAHGRHFGTSTGRRSRTSALCEHTDCLEAPLGRGTSARSKGFQSDGSSHCAQTCMTAGGGHMRYIFAALLLAFLCGCRTNESPEGQVDDLQITAQVKAKLASDVGLSSVTNVSVNSTNAVATLSGLVDSAATKAKAESVARSVPKVARVVNNLQVAVPHS
jgi:hypothetical protein